MEWRSGWRAELVYHDEGGESHKVQGELVEVSTPGGDIQKFRLEADNGIEYFVDVSKHKTQAGTWDTTNEVYRVTDDERELIGSASTYRPLGPT